MGFIAKKVISAFLMPLPLLLLIGLLGLWLLWSERSLRWGKRCVSVALLGIAVLSFYPVSSSLLSPYEQVYDKFDIEAKAHIPVAAVMVLGHGHVNDPQRPLAAQLSGEALARLVEAIRILRHYPEAELIVSGYDGGTGLKHADLMADTAEQLGVPSQRILRLTETKDTNQEAELVKSRIGNQPFVLVSSASHLPRSMALFASHDLHPIPAPGYYLAQNRIHEPWHRFAPKGIYLYQTERYWHEWLGRQWASLSGALRASPDEQPTDSPNPNSY